MDTIAMNPDRPSTHQKALHINFDNTRYGAFAEIGAGQEVVRWFFLVGGASGTVAKTISAYDMAVSDAIYGACGRYVSRQRLRAMLDYEYKLLLERLSAKRGDATTFFVYANTMAARSFTRHEEGQGWMGIRFQHQPHAEPSEIIIHVRMLDGENAREQEAIGILGVNLIYGAFLYSDDPPKLIASLLDGLSTDRIDLDMIRFSGPRYATVDNRLMSLQLVEQKFTDVAMFTARGEVVEAAELIYKKPILIERGSFRPITNLTLAILESARARYHSDEPPVVLMEMTLRQLQTGGDKIEHADFLARVDTLGTLGHPVMISKYLRYHRLVPFLRRLTPKRIGFAMGLRNGRQLYDEHYYDDMPGGILQALGELFQGDIKLYVCPAIDTTTGKIVAPVDFKPPSHLTHLYAHLLDNNLLETIPVDNTLLSIFSRDVLDKIQSGDPSWEKMVPSPVVQMIKERKFFGCSGGL
jgi:hypothetical protein